MADEEGDITQFERDRNARIARNKQLLSKLKVDVQASAIRQAVDDEKKKAADKRNAVRAKIAPSPRAPARRSGRSTAAETRRKMKEVANVAADEDASEDDDEDAGEDSDEDEDAVKRRERDAADYDPLNDVGESDEDADEDGDANVDDDDGDDDVIVDADAAKTATKLRKPKRARTSAAAVQAWTQAKRKSSGTARKPRSGGDASVSLPEEVEDVIDLADSSSDEAEPSSSPACRPTARRGGVGPAETGDAGGTQGGGKAKGRKPKGQGKGNGPKASRKGKKAGLQPPSEAEIVAAFGQFDSQGRGMLTTLDIHRMATRLGIDINADLLESMMERAAELTGDADGEETDMLTFTQFQTLVAKLS